MSKPSPRPFATCLVPPLAFPTVPDDKRAAANLWFDVFWEAKEHESSIAFNLGFSSTRHFNPEYFLPSWARIVLEDDGFRHDAWGWALEALRLEHEKQIGKPLNDGDMLDESHSAHFLERFRIWAQARLDYHRTALRLTFYAADSLAEKEPLASDPARLRARFTDWGNVCIAEQRRLFESNPDVKQRLENFVPDEHFSLEDVRRAEFQRWLDKEGEASGCVGTEWNEWLPWLHLISPISCKWDLRGVAWAICKSFGGQEYRQDVENWWATSRPLTYATATKDDGFVETVIKGIIPLEQHDWRAEWLAKRLVERVQPPPAKKGSTVRTNKFVENLRKRLESVDFNYRKATGRRKAVKDEPLPELSALGKSATHKKEEDEGISSGADWEADEPDGWLLANSLKP